MAIRPTPAIAAPAPSTVASTPPAGVPARQPGCAACARPQLRRGLHESGQDDLGPANRRAGSGGGPRDHGPARGEPAIAASTAASVAPSRPAVGSSSSSRGASRRNARASATRWRSPADSPAPRSPSGSPGRRSRSPSRGRRRARRGHLAVSASGRPSGTFSRDRAREQVRALRHPGDLVPPRVRVELGQVDAADQHPPAAGRRTPAAPRAGGLAAAAGTGRGPRLARLDPYETARPARLRRAREYATLSTSIGRPRGSGTSVRCRRRSVVEHLEHLLGRGQPVGAGVEAGAYLPQRQVRLRREHQHEQRGAAGRASRRAARSPTDTATSATERVASSSSTSEERNARRSVAIG